MMHGQQNIKLYMQQSPEQGTLLPEILNVIIVQKFGMKLPCLPSSKYTQEPVFFMSLRLDSVSWPPLRGFAVALIGHTTLGRTPLNE